MLRRISAVIFFAMRSSRYSSRYFIFLPSGIDLGRFQLSQLIHARQMLVRARRLLLVNLANRKADVDHYVVADLRIRKVFQAGLAGNPAEIHFGHPDSMLFMEFDNLSRNRETHEGSDQ